MNIAGNADGFLRNVEALREANGGAVSLDDVADVVHCLMTSIEGDINLADLKLHDELSELVDFIRITRAEIASIQPDRIRQEQIRPASDELDEVVNATADATDTILDVAESLEALVEEEGDVARGDVIRGLATRIYEASSFQDITGQRISKVVNLLKTIEDKLANLADVSEGTSPRAAVEDVADGEDGGLLNGPSMPDAANNQDDIDALLASFD